VGSDERGWVPRFSPILREVGITLMFIRHRHIVFGFLTLSR